MRALRSQINKAIDLLYKLEFCQSQTCPSGKSLESVLSTWALNLSSASKCAIKKQCVQNDPHFHKRIMN